MEDARLADARTVCEKRQGTTCIPSSDLCEYNLARSLLSDMVPQAVRDR